MVWKLTTLIENHGDKEGVLACEHGLSVLIEGEGFRMLMDTGQSGAFYENAEKMGLSLADLDCLLLSHAHYDHTGGLFRLINRGSMPKKVYVGRHFFRKCYHRKADGHMKFIGMKFDRQILHELGVPVEEICTDSLDIAGGVTLYRNFEQITDYEKLNPDFFYQEEDSVCAPFGRCADSLNYIPDSFEDETAVALETGEGLFVVAGCSHPGIVNILTTISARSGRKICGVIGGTHLVDADETRVRKTAEDFKKLGIRYVGVSHCTGDQNLRILKECFGEGFVFNCTGNVIVLS